MKYAVIENKKIVEINEDISGVVLPEGYEIGDICDNGVFVRIAKKAPLQEWSASMIASDEKLPRWAEDIIDGIISDETKKLVADKKALRLTKP